MQQDGQVVLVDHQQEDYMVVVQHRLPSTDHIDFVTIATTSDALDFGDLELHRDMSKHVQINSWYLGWWKK